MKKEAIKSHTVKRLMQSLVTTPRNNYASFDSRVPTGEILRTPQSCTDLCQITENSKMEKKGSFSKSHVRVKSAIRFSNKYQ